MEDLWDLEKKPFKTGAWPAHEGHFPTTFPPCTSGVKTLRLNPLKNVRFRSSFWWFPCKRKRNHGFGPHFLQSQRHTSLQNGGKRISGSHFWWFPYKCCIETILESLVDLKKRGLKTGKQHRLAGSGRPFSNHFSPTSDVKTSRLNPLKNIRFRSSFWLFPCKRNHGFGPHFLQSQRRTSLQNELKRISHLGWYPCQCCRNHTRKPRGPQETRPQNGKTAWPGRLTKAIFEPLFPHLRCQNVASESSKNVRFRSSFWWFPCKRNHGFGPHFLQSQRHTSLQNGKRIFGSRFWWFPCKCCIETIL